MRQRNFLLVSTSGRLFGTTLLTVGGTFFRDARYGAFFTLVGFGIAIILLVMIYRENIEKWFRMLRVRHHRKIRMEKRRAKEQFREP
jgi:uncharacterized membrane protein YdjX (TVP38/TMEM64 family)